MAFARYIEARMLGRVHGQQTISVLHFGTDEAAADNDALVALLIQLAEAIILCAINQLAPAASIDWTLEGVDCRQLFPLKTDPVLTAAPAGTVGGRGTINASFESIVMRKKSGLAGKKFRGRAFLPPPGDADLVNSVLIDGDANNFYSGFVACLAGKFIGAAKTEPFTMGVLSRKNLSETNNDYVTSFTPLTTLSIDQKLTSLRSRKLRTGS